MTFLDIWQLLGKLLSLFPFWGKCLEIDVTFMVKISLFWQIQFFRMGCGGVVVCTHPKVLGAERNPNPNLFRSAPVSNILTCFWFKIISWIQYFITIISYYKTYLYSSPWWEVAMYELIFLRIPPPFSTIAVLLIL